MLARHGRKGVIIGANVGMSVEKAQRPMLRQRYDSVPTCAKEAEMKGRLLQDHPLKLLTSQLFLEAL